MSLVVDNLEKEGVRLLRECEPRAVKRVGGEGEEGRGDEGMLEVTWYCRNAQDTHQVCLNLTHPQRGTVCLCATACLSVSDFPVLTPLCHRKNGTQCCSPQVSN